ncbi:MAG: hypothetical protein C5B50_28150 [Verrucomicrobia bacterium]|nr:MAG: hypothetical protein C5B50_28150 [Verrucomicrobiota bacterium]
MQRVPIKPLTLIFGPNASGKSSIIQTLLLARHGMYADEKESSLGPGLDGGVHLGGFPNFVHKQDRSRNVVVRLETAKKEGAYLDLDGDSRESNPLQQCSRFAIELQFGLPEEGKVPKAMAALPHVRLLDIFMDGRRAVSLHGCYGSCNCRMVDSDHPLLEASLATILKWSLSSSKEPLEQQLRELARRRLAARLSEANFRAEILGEGASVSAADLLKDEPSLGEVSIESELAVLKQVFSKAMVGRLFLLLATRLQDLGPYNGHNRQIWDEWLNRGDGTEGFDDRPDGSLTTFFKYHREEEEDAENWWPEAQAICHNLGRLIEEFTDQITRSLSSVHHLGPVRRVPGRHDWRIGAYEPREDEKVNEWLGKLGTCYLRKTRRWIAEQDPAVDQAVNPPPTLFEPLLHDTGTNTVLSVHDVGFGIGQVLPILESAAALRERLIAIEQPEAQLHPAQQAELGDIFIESALGERKNTFILETHSEHLILRIMRRIRDTTKGGDALPKGLPSVRPRDVAVLYVERQGDHSIVREMPLNESGELVKAWPGGFFEESFNEMFA